MMRRRYGEWILGMFAAGVILGTAAVNLGGEDFREQAGGMAEALFAGAQASRGAFWELLRMTALCRAGETALLWAAGFLGAGRMLCCLLAGRHFTWQPCFPIFCSTCRCGCFWRGAPAIGGESPGGIWRRDFSSWGRGFSAKQW